MYSCIYCRHFELSICNIFLNTRFIFLYYFKFFSLKRKCFLNAALSQTARKRSATVGPSRRSDPVRNPRQQLLEKATCVQSGPVSRRCSSRRSSVCSAHTTSFPETRAKSSSVSWRRERSICKWLRRRRTTKRKASQYMWGHLFW